MKCSQCGAELPNNANFCRVCGAPVEKLQPGQASRKPKRRRGAAVLRGIAAAVMTILVVFAASVGALYLTGYLDSVTDALFGRGSAHEAMLQQQNSETAVMSAPNGETATFGAVHTEGADGSEELVADAGTQIEAPPLSPEALPTDPETRGKTVQNAPLDASELENAVLTIREKYNRILSGIAAGEYRAFSPRAGVLYYYSGVTLTAAVMQKNVDGTEYARSYYFDGGAPIFASFEADDAYLLYIRSGALIRLRYAPDATARDKATDYDQQTDEIYQQWQELVMSEAQYLLLDFTAALNTNMGSEAEFLLPDSASRYLTEDDLIGLNAEQCRLARNEIYARHGRRFNDASLQRYFDSCSWYEGTTDPEVFRDSVFNEYERANILLIMDYETAHGYR